MRWDGWSPWWTAPPAGWPGWRPEPPRREGSPGCCCGGWLPGDRVADRWDGTVASLLVLVLCVAPAAWLLNVRFALHGLLELPETLGGVAARRSAPFRDVPRPPPPRGLWPTVQAVRGIVRDYRDVVGSWSTLAQLLAPSFWLLTVVALAMVPVVVVAAAIAGLVV